jgi:hypothetical protein
VALPLARRGGPLVTFLVLGAWLAPGDSVGEYLDAHQAWLGRRGGGVGESFVGPEAEVAAGVELVSSVIGAGARVSGRGPCDRVVAWPGARLEAPLRDAVVTTAGRIVRRTTASP